MIVSVNPRYHAVLREISFVLAFFALLHVIVFPVMGKGKWIYSAYFGTTDDQLQKVGTEIQAGLVVDKLMQLLLEEGIRAIRKGLYKEKRNCLNLDNKAFFSRFCLLV